MRLFLAVARSGTLTAAAEVLNVSAATLHRRLAAFEEELGAALFERGPRGHQLTHVGAALLPRAEEVEEAVLAANRTVIGHDQQASGDVRIAMPLVMLPLLAPHLAEFSRVVEKVRPILMADDGLLDLGRSTDIALRATTTPLESAVARNLCGLAWGRYASVRTEGDALPWVQYLDMDSHPAVQWCARAFPSPRVVMVVGGVASMLAVLGGSGAQGLLPCFVGDRDPSLRRIGEPVAENRLWLLVHADLRRSARVRAVTDFLVPRLLSHQAELEGRGPEPRGAGGAGEKPGGDPDPKVGTKRRARSR
ncbi:MAG TPA: LysR family transcriptional regulator [Myxococcota bacterium]|nr:LysR family transcriptional regulator [Myxococcota bacterium]